jgi:hypothetical protein
MVEKKEQELKLGQIKLIRPFGPAIAHIKMPENLIEELNNYTDKIINDEKKANELDVGKQLAGQLTQEFELEEDFMKKIGWIDFLKKGTENWISFATGKKISKFEMLSSWIVRQFENEYNPIHWHTGHISGVGYLKMPKSLGEPLQKSKVQNPNGQIALVHGNKMFLSDPVIKFKPEVGNFYLFPNYMMHTVYPFSNSKEERRSISFNARIDDEIYNVYGNEKRPKK